KKMADIDDIEDIQDIQEAEAMFEAVSYLAAKSNNFVLNECSLMANDDPKEKDENGNEKTRRQAPIGVRHKDDGVQTPDRFSWAHSLDKWYAVWIWAGIPAVQIMTQSRLSMALGYVGQEKPVSLRNILKVTDELDYSYGPTVAPIEKSYDISSVESFELEHRISLPDVILVETLPKMEREYVSSNEQEYESETQTFERILPPPDTQPNEASLAVKITFSSHETDRVGHGNSAQVFRVMMEHPEITTEHGDNTRAKDFVSNEGNSYAISPDYLSEAREGYIQTKPIHQPQPCVAAMPKFYGMYKDKNGQLMLLLEECGTPIRPEKLKPHHK
ncbi:3751_t:CDS:2, partial [Acaulospora colombiana]